MQKKNIGNSGKTVDVINRKQWLKLSLFSLYHFSFIVFNKKKKKIIFGSVNYDNNSNLYKVFNTMEKV